VSRRGTCDRAIWTKPRKTTLFGMGYWGGRYLASHIRDMRFRPAIDSVPNGPSGRLSGIAFTYGGRTVSFADQIDESEATEVIRRIQQCCVNARTPQTPAA
jgi:hypothetical protein